MNELIKKCEKLYSDLRRFSSDVLELGDEINDARIETFEQTINVKLPFDFKYFLLRSNGFGLMGNEVYGIGEEFRGSSLQSVYEFEHAARSFMPLYFVPFSPDGRGNHYCLDVSRMEELLCPIVFWQSDCHYTSIDEVETCNKNFLSWVEEVLIAWTLEDYNYDGSDK